MSLAGVAYRRPESVLVVVYAVDAQVLLLKRRNPFVFWQSVTGSLQQGEPHAMAARRELAEETGLNGDNLVDSGVARTFTIDPRWRYRFEPGTVENLEHEWRLGLAETVNIMLDTTEHSEFRWLPIDNAIDEVWSWTNKEALEQLRKEL